ncbi:RAVE protein 1 C terminal-domain-containing protein [Hyaloraphidium curvatum]|nr:RAVE protein 1 C terminal-domain-containing protein [Hyaloraphidium curvatum]
MHLKQQHISGKANGPECVSLAGFNGSRYIVYGSDKLVVVYTDEFSHVQTFEGIPPTDTAAAAPEHQHVITSVAMCPGMGFIAAASGMKISIWKPIAAAAGDVLWGYVTTVTTDFDVTTMDWTNEGTLAIGGGSLALLSFVAAGDALNTQVLFSSRVSGPVQRARFSPDGTILATYGKNDRLVKLWFRRTVSINGSQTTSYDFSYLPHSRAIVYAEWRRPRKDVRYAEENVLLTMSHDNICRLWSQATPENPSKFYMCCLIDISQTPASLNVSGPEMVAIHWLDQQELHAAIAMRVEMEERGLKAIRKSRRISPDDTRKVKKLKETVKDNPDILIQIQQDGTVVLWGIQHLLTQPRRMPKVIVLMKTKNALLPHDYAFFKDTPHVFQNANVIRSSGVFLPSEIYFLTQNEAGVINVYMENLDEFFAITRDSSHIRLLRSFAGHRLSPVKFVRHPMLDFCASIGRDGELNVWKVTIPEIGIRYSEGLDFVAALPQDVAPRKLAWFPTAPILLVQNNSGLFAFSVGQSSIDLLHKFDGYGADSAFLMLQAFSEPKEPVHAGDDPQTMHAIVVAVCEDAQVMIWTAVLKGGRELSDVVLVDEDRLSLPHGASLKFASPTNAIVSMYSPTAPLGSHMFLTYTDDNVIRFWQTRTGTLDVLRRESVATKFKTSCETIVGSGIDFASVKRVKASPFGKVAIVYSRGAQDVISILDYEATGTRAREEGEIVFDDPVVDLDWNLTADAQVLLAVAVGKEIKVYCPHRVEAMGLHFNIFNVPVWKQITKIGLRDDVNTPRGALGRCLAWMNNGLLIFATDHEITCYSKWLRDEKMVSKAGETGLSRELTVFQKASKVNGRLPDHHPMLLIQYMLWGKYDYVKYILGLLYRYVRLMADAKREIKDIPIPLWKLFNSLEIEQVDTADQEALYEQLFGSGNQDRENAEAEFSAQDAQALLELLTTVALPGIDANEQLILMAVVDTVIQGEQQRRSLDENGIRYILYLRLSLYLSKVMPGTRESQIQPVDIFWAYHSESQDILYETCVSVAGGKLLWPQARAYGMGFWMKNLETLRKTFEIIGRNHFKEKEEGDAVACAVFFLALRKKNLLLALWKTTPSTAERETMIKFLSNDFTQARWQTAAAKNAFALMSRQRFEYAVAFFLLGDRLRDAVSVCLKQLDDPQLAFAITRVFEGDNSELLKEITGSHMLPRSLAQQDRWMASLAFSAMQDREKAILSLMIPLDVLAEDRPCPPVTKELLAALNDPALLVGYDYLKRYYASVRFFPLVPQDVETEFIYQTICAYEKIGCPALALKILEQFNDWLPQPDPKLLDSDSRAGSPENGFEDAAVLASFIRRRGSLALDSGLADWGVLTAVQKAVDNLRHQPPKSRQSSAASQDHTGGGRRKSRVSLDYLSQPPAANGSVGTGTTPSALLGVPSANPAPVSEKAEDFDWSQPMTRTKEPESYVSSILDTSLDLPKPGGTLGFSKAVHNAEDTPDMDRKTAFNFLMENRNARLFKWFLGMRLVQAATTATANVCDNMDVLQSDPVFSSFFDSMHDGLNSMSEAIEMPLEVLDRVINLRCREADVFRAYIELLPLTGELASYAESLALFMVQECNTVARLAFEVARKALPPVFVEFISSFSRRLLASLNRWQQKSAGSVDPAAALSFIPQAAVTAFVTWLLSANMMKDFATVANLIQCTPSFFAALRNRDLPAVFALVDSLLSGNVPLVPAADSGDPDSDQEFDEATAEFRPKPKSAENLVADDVVLYFALTYASARVGDYLLVLEDSGSDTLYSFVRDGLLRPLSTLLYRVQSSILESPLFTAPEGAPTLPQVVKLIRGGPSRKLWAVVKDLATPTLMYDVLVARLPMRANGSAHEVDVVYRNSDAVGSLAINPLDENIVAVATAKGILELDIEAAIFFNKADFADGSEDGSPLSASKRSSPADSGPLIKTRSSAKLPVDADNGTRLRRSITGLSCIEPHPTLNYYLAAVSEQASSNHPPYISLYQFGQPDPLISYNRGSPTKITRCRFDPVGHVFGASDASGVLTLWRFESQEKAALPFASFSCHSNTLHDFCFLGSTTLIATAGSSSGNANVCIWDTLLPSARARIRAFTVHDGGAYSLAYAARHQLLFSGGKKGDICIYDVRQRTLLNTLQAHSTLVKTLAIDEDQDMFISGSSDGELVAWSLTGFGRKETWSNVHHASKALRMPRPASSTSGVMEVVIRGAYAFTCGSGGVRRSLRLAE